MNKRTLIIAGGSIIGFFIVLIIIVFIVGSLSPSYLSYSNFEERLSSAAKKYYTDNPSFLPTEDGESTLLYSTLVSGGYIKPLTELLENGESCNAEVIISKYGSNYSYIPYLTCPGDYETKELYSVVLENNPVVKEEIGLYKVNDGYFFRGEVTTNYVLLDNEIWRILRINEDNSMTIIRKNPYEDSKAWDNRYNIENKSRCGINDFDLSRIKDTLMELSAGNEIFSDSTKAKLTARNLCIGKRSKEESTRDGSVECATKTEEKFLLGLITASEFMYTSLDENCTSTISRSCSNYNFLSLSYDSSWTITGITDNTRSVLYYSTIGTSYTDASSKNSINLTAYLSRRAFYSSGKGTSDDPYKLK